MLYPVEVVAGLSSVKNIDFLAEEGSKFDDFFPRTSVWDIDVFRSIRLEQIIKMTIALALALELALALALALEK